MVSWQSLIFGVIILSAIGTIIEKKTLFKEHAMEFSAALSVLIAFLSLFLVPLLDFNFPQYYWPILYLLSLMGTIGFLFVAKATRHLEISLSSPLFAFGPIITAILAWTFLSEGLSAVQIGGIGLVFMGSYFLEMKPKKSFRKELFSPIKEMIKLKYVHFIFLALLLYGVSDIIGRYILNSANNNLISPITFIFVIHIFMAINFIILLHVYHNGFTGIKHGFKSAGKLIFVMAIIVFSYRLLTIYAMTIPAAKIALIAAFKRGSTVLSTFFGGEIFKDKHLKQRTLASLIMVFGAILIAL